MTQELAVNPQIEQAFINDNIIRPWFNEAIRSTNVRDVLSNIENRKWIDSYCHQLGGFSKENLDAALVALLKALDEQKQFQAAKQRLGSDLVHWFESVRNRNDNLKYFALSDRNWSCARNFLAAIKDPPVLSIGAWEQFVVDHEYTPQFFDWEISPEQLIEQISGAREPYIMYSKVNVGGRLQLRPSGGLLCDKYGSLAVSQAFDQFTNNVATKAASISHSSHTTEEWRKVENQKAVEAKARRQEDPRLIQRMEQETRNIVWVYREGNHAATQRGRRQLQNVIDSGLASGKSWFEIYDLVQAEANRLAGL